MKEETGSLIELNIEKMAIGGAGIARHEGLVYFVPFTVPGDRVLAKLTLKKKNFAEAELVQVIKPSEERVSAPCAVFGKCGGCNWQQMSRKSQLDQKKLLLKETLEKFLSSVSVPDFQIQASPRDLNYRNRIQPKFVNGKLGFFGKKTHAFVETDECLICEKELSDYFPSLKKELKTKFANLDPKEMPRIELFLNENAKPEWHVQSEDAEGFAFAQVNRFQNQDLIQTCLEHSAGDFDRIFDLYAGSGNFTFPLALKFSESRPSAKLLAVELNQASVARAQAKCKADKQFKNRVQFYLASVDVFLKREKPAANDLVVLDPPRAGCSPEVVRALATAGPKRIVYISCHPVSLARDVQLFLNENSNYEISFVQAFEMFPQTDHFETILVLNRKS